MNALLFFGFASPELRPTKPATRSSVPPSGLVRYTHALGLQVRSCRSVQQHGQAARTANKAGPQTTTYMFVDIGASDGQNISGGRDVLSVKCTDVNKHSVICGPLLDTEIEKKVRPKNTGVAHRAK